MKPAPAVFALLLGTFCCIAGEPTPATPATWEDAFALALAKAKAGEVDHILDHMLAPSFVDKMIGAYGKDAWRDKCRENKLKKLPYFYGWCSKTRTVKVDGDKVVVNGEHGCYAMFYKIDGVFRLGDFGQTITSM